jgi:hypothetical protein
MMRKLISLVLVHLVLFTKVYSCYLLSFLFFCIDGLFRDVQRTRGGSESSQETEVNKR